MNTKKCLYCTEEISSETIKCKYCSIYSSISLTNNYKSFSFNNSTKLIHSGVDRYCSVLSPLDDIDFNSYRPYLQFTIVVKSGNLWSSKLTQRQKKNYQVVKTLRKEGLTYKQISDKMNEMGLSPIRTNKFTPSLVHSLEKKMEKRKNRLTRVFQPTLGEMKLVFENDYFD